MHHGKKWMLERPCGKAARARGAVLGLCGRYYFCSVALHMHWGCGTPAAPPQTLLSHPLPNLPAHCLVFTSWSQAAEAIWWSKAGHIGKEEGGRWSAYSTGKLRKAGKCPEFALEDCVPLFGSPGPEFSFPGPVPPIPYSSSGASRAQALLAWRLPILIHRLVDWQDS